MATATQVVSTAAIVVVAGAAGFRYAKHRRAADRDVFLAFLPYAIMSVATFGWSNDADWTARWVLVLMYSQPVLFAVLVRHVGANPIIPVTVAAAGSVFSTILLWNASPEVFENNNVTPELAAASVAAFVVPNLWVGGVFTYRAWESTGVARTRLAWAAASAFLFLISLSTYQTTVEVGTNAALIGDSLSLLLATAFLLGFAPPRWVQRAWQASAYFQFLDRTRDVGPTLERPEVDRRLLVGARSVLDVEELAFSDRPGWEPDQESAPTGVPGAHAYLVATFDGPRLFPDDDRDTLQSLASHAGRVLTDTDRLHQEEERRQAAEEQATFKASFLRHFGHEVANPLSPLRIQVKLLEGEATEGQRGRFDVIDRSIRRMDEIIADVSAVAKAIDPKAPREMAEHDLGALVREAVATYTEAAAAAGCTLDVAVEGDCRLTCDRARILQVVDNLLSNAIKYSPKGGGIQARVHPHDGGVQLELVDHGLGFTPEQSERLFQTYSRVHRQVAPGIPGSGLGLYLVQEVAHAHGGRAAASSQGPGLGSTFTVWLPAKPWAQPGIAMFRA